MIRLVPAPLGRAVVMRSVGRSLRTTFGTIAVAGELPRGGAVIASTHGSWWDGYVLGALAGAVGRRSAVMMTSERLAAFPFLRLAGATGTELAAELHRTFRDVVATGMDRIDPGKDIRITLVEAADRILPAVPPRLSAEVMGLLAKIGVADRTQAALLVAKRQR